MGCKIHLNDVSVFHLYQQNHRSEYQRSESKKRKLLEKTAKIFFKNTLAPEIFSALETYLKDEFLAEDPASLPILFLNG